VERVQWRHADRSTFEFRILLREALPEAMKDDFGFAVYFGTSDGEGGRYSMGMIYSPGVWDSSRFLGKPPSEHGGAFRLFPYCEWMGEVEGMEVGSTLVIRLDRRLLKGSEHPLLFVVYRRPPGCRGSVQVVEVRRLDPRLRRPIMVPYPPS
jgi:hypothetical protein